MKTVGTSPRCAGWPGLRSDRLRRTRACPVREIPNVDNFRPLWTTSQARTFSCAQPVDGIAAGRRAPSVNRTGISTALSPCCAQGLRRVCTGYPQACAQHRWTPASAGARLSEPFDRTDLNGPRGQPRECATGKGEVAPVSVAEIAPRGEDFERTPPHDIAAEQCVLGGMLMSKDAISDVLEVIQGRRLTTGPLTRSCTRSSSTCTAGASRRRGHRGGRADQARRHRPDGRRAVPAHADRLRADGRERRLLRPHRPGAGDPAPAGRGRAPASSSSATPATGTPTSWSTGPRPRSTASPTGGSARTTCRCPRSCPARWTRSRPSAAGAAR